MTDDLVKRLRNYGSSHLKGSPAVINEAADAIERITRERDEARDKYHKQDGMNGAVTAAIRDMLNHHNVPQVTFIDDHVGNAIAQRDAAQAFIRDLVDMQSGAGWSRAIIREAAADFLRTAGAPTGKGKDTSPAFLRAATLESENARLREALEPFAHEADEWCATVPDERIPGIMDDGDDGPDLARFTVGDLRRARAALGGSND